MRSKKTLAVLSATAFLALAGCGGEDKENDPPAAGGTTTTTPEKPPPPAKVASEAKLYDGENFNPNDLADCLLDADVGAGVTLDGAAIDLHDAQAQVIVEQGNGDILVYDDADSAEAALPDYGKSFGNLSETGAVRNVLWQADPDLDENAKNQLKGCLGAS